MRFVRVVRITAMTWTTLRAMSACAVDCTLRPKTPVHDAAGDLHQNARLDPARQHVWVQLQETVAFRMGDDGRHAGVDETIEDAFDAGGNTVM